MKKTNETNNEESEAGYNVGDYFNLSMDRRKEIMEDVANLFNETKSIESIEIAIKETMDSSGYDENDLFYSGFAMCYIVCSNRKAEDVALRRQFKQWLNGLGESVDPLEQCFPIQLNQVISSGVFGSLMQQGEVEGGEEAEFIPNASENVQKPDEVDKEMDKVIEKQPSKESGETSEESIRDYLDSKKPEENKEEVKTKKRLRIGKRNKQ